MKYASVCLVLLGLAACGGSRQPLVQDLQGREGFSAYQLVSVRGTRDGDRLDAQAMLSDSSAILTLDMRFAVGTPTTLAGGTWNWARGRQMSGKVSAQAVTFLGGQDGPPSLGGTFDLMDSEGVARYRVNLPNTVVKRLP